MEINIRGLAVVLISLAGPLGAEAAEPSISQEHLVLWLDASDSATQTVANGRVAEWRDKSAHGHRAVQPDAGARPRPVEDAIGGRPAVRFGGEAFLNLGQPPALDIPPGEPFTVVAVYSADEGKFGTLLAKGGGPQTERAYHFYTAAGRLGGIVHGTRRETPLGAGPRLVALVSDGRSAELRHDSASIRFTAGQGGTPGDVLVGVRRETAENTGIFWPLDGDLAELIVYRAALDKRQFAQVDGYLRKKYELAGAGPATYETLAQTARQNPAQAAESLLRLAEQNQLSADLADLAGELLTSDDPFARGMTEWAIAMKVGGENNGQSAVWQHDAAEPWFQRYMNLDSEQRREADWVRQAVARNIHRDPAKLLADLDTLLKRSEQMAADFRLSGLPPDELDGRVASLAAVRAKLAESAARGEQGLAASQQLWLDARRTLREIALSNPAVDFGQIVFLTQFAPHTVRNITRSYAWKHKPGGDVVILDDLAAGGPARPVLAGRLGPGYVWGLDLWWDADRVLFSYARLPNWPPPVNTAHYAVEGENVFELRKIFEPTRLYEAAIDGSQITQLTDDPYWSDFEPAYTATGDVVFASDRCGKAPECGNVTYDHTNPNLYLLSRRGSRLAAPSPEDGLARYEPAPVVRKFTDSKDLDRYPYSLDDGRIVYTHWEYQERHFMEVHSLWTARPDGTMSDALFKHHMSAPLALRTARSIPGTAKLVAIATGHHTFSYGSVVTIDTAHGLNSESGLRVLTPSIKLQEGPMAGRPVDGGGVHDAGGLYRSPWALSETCLLVSYAYARPNCTGTAGIDSNGFGLYLIDAYGNRELIHRDPLLSCATPIPLRPRKRPPILAELAAEGPTATAAGEAVCYVADVYADMPEVARGSIKRLRIAQHVPWPYDSDRGTQDYISGVAGAKHLGFTSWSPVRVIGTVPVESDGSAYFTVPADVAIYFQALDDREMEVRRMRSFVSLKAGEVRGCHGCHESQARTADVRTGFRLALGRVPSEPAPPPWGSEQLLGYEWLVQPILDRHCSECHGAAAPEGGVELTAVRAGADLLRSYHTLLGSGGDGKITAPVLVSVADRFSNASVTQPKQSGSHRSRLIRALIDDPLHVERVKLSPDEWTALVTWVDANAPYYDKFINKRPDCGGPPRREPIQPLAEAASQ
ncbi:MAG: hypothetical protein RBS80_08600 [Thermoguttaceae bacterium]|nr:hypothetical protein [Thermoguttaceae bacterium]